MARYHFTGIKGSGMSSLALILQQWGHQVQGSDVSETYFTQFPLEASGIPIYTFGEPCLQSSMTLIAGNAFNDEHPELIEAKQLNVPILRYHHLLGEMIKPFTSIAVSGTHGKTSTTGLLSHVLSYHQPINFLIGDGSGKGVQHSEYFAFEACEYKRHFHAYEPTYSVITNIEMDHPDYFKDLSDVMAAFNTFSEQTSKVVIVCGDDENVRNLSTSTSKMTYGIDSKNDVFAMNIRTDESFTIFDVYHHSAYVTTISIPSFGSHNVKNALAVVCVLLLENMEPSDYLEAFSTFGGVKRRFTESTVGTNVVIDDYAHHPTEIRATMEAVRSKYKTREIVAIFQPHTYSRTKMFLDEFALSLSAADHVFVCDIFGSARESKGDITSDALSARISGGQSMPLSDVYKLQQFENAVLVFMGAGDIQKYEDAYRSVMTVK